MSTKKVFGNLLITGATGFLGSELLAQVLDSGEADRVVCLVRDRIPKSRFFTDGMCERVVVVSGDLRDQELIDRVMNEYDINTVFHLAAQTIVGQANSRPTETLDVNIRGTWALLEACRMNSKNLRAVVFASSDKAYGVLDGEKYDEAFPLAGRFPYDVSKSCSDLICQMYANTYGLPISITRCGNFFGPGDLNTSRIFPSTILSVLRGERPLIRSDGMYIRDYIFISDGAAAYRELAKRLISAQKDLAGEAFNFSYELKLTVVDVVRTILREMGSNLEPIILNEANHEIPIQALDSKKAMKYLNWAPAYGFEQGVRITADWYKERFSDV